MHVEENNPTAKFKRKKPDVIVAKDDDMIVA